MKEILKQLKKQLTKDWGKPCPDFHVGCNVCLVWRSYQDLEDMEVWINQ